MRKLLRSLASLALKTKLSSSWGESFNDGGWLFELLDIDLDYSKDLDYSIEDTHFPDTKAPFVYTHAVGLTVTVANFHLDFIVSYETEP